MDALFFFFSPSMYPVMASATCDGISVLSSFPSNVDGVAGKDFKEVSYTPFFLHSAEGHPVFVAGVPPDGLPFFFSPGETVLTQVAVHGACGSVLQRSVSPLLSLPGSEAGRGNRGYRGGELPAQHSFFFFWESSSHTTARLGGSSPTPVTPPFFFSLPPLLSLRWENRIHRPHGPHLSVTFESSSPECTDPTLATVLSFPFFFPFFLPAAGRTRW